MKVRINTYVNLRTELAEIHPYNNPGDIYFSPGDVINVAETVIGENYKGNNLWYRLEEGGYVWTGADDNSKITVEPNFWLKKFGLDLLQQQLQQKLSNVSISILDTGIDEMHPDLKDVVNLKFNAVSENEPIEDEDGHGTHCSGIIIGTAKNKISGVARGAKLNVCKIMNTSSGSFTGMTVRGLIRALDKVGDQSDVISISAGVDKYNKELHDKIKTFAERGVIIVAAIGNVTTEDRTAKYPAMFDECIAVGSLNNHLELSDLTVRNSKIDICFPGELITSTLPNNSYGQKSGTSMATPFIAGLAALMKANNAESNYTVFRELLKDHAVQKQKEQLKYYAIKNEKILL